MQTTYTNKLMRFPIITKRSLPNLQNIIIIIMHEYEPSTSTHRSIKLPPQAKQKQVRPLILWRGLSSGSVHESPSEVWDEEVSIIPSFRSVYRPIDYTWSDHVVITIKWGRDYKPDISEVELPRGYYNMTTHAIASGGCHIQVICHQATNPPLSDTVASFPYATDSNMTARFTVSQAKGILRFDIRQAVKNRDTAGALTLIIQTRGSDIVFNARVDRISTVEKVEEVALLSKITRKDLGDTHPLWVSELPQLARGWSRDLLREGIEPNPGPTDLSMFIIDRTRATKNLSYAESLIALLEPNLRSNPFALLGLFTSEVVEVTEEDMTLVDEPETCGHSSKRTRKISTPEQRTEAKHREKPEETAAPRNTTKNQLSIEERATQLTNVAVRICKKMMGAPSPQKALVYWMRNNPPRKLMLKVIGLMKLDLTPKTLDPYQFAVFAYCNDISPQDIFDSYVDAFDPTMIYSVEDRAQMYKDLIITAKPYVIGASRAHNKTMHALNGNIFVQAFDEVKASPNWKTVVRAPQGVGSASGRNISDYETYFSSYGKMSGPSVTDLRDMDGVTSDLVHTNNTVSSGKRVRFPCSPLHPMTFYSSSAATSLIRPNIGLPYVSAGLVEYRNNLLTDTAKCSEIKQAVQNAASTRFRATDIDASGFMSLDVANIARESIAKGFSMETPVMKWMLLADILALPKNNTVPRSVYMNIDGYIPHDPEKAELKYGRSIASIAEIVNPQFPFVGGKGTIRFHLSLETVEACRRSSAVFVPPMMFQNAINPQINVFLFIIGLVEWPFNLYSVLSKVTSPTGTEYTIDYIHRACLTRIPGPIDIDLIIPRRTSESKPRTNTDAVRLAQLCPITTVNNVKTKVTFTTEISDQKDNELAAYLDTYAEVVTLGDVYNFMSAVNLKHDISNTVDICHDLLAGCVYTFPQLLDDTTSIHYPGGVDWGASVSGVGLRKLTDTATIWGGILPRTGEKKAPWTDARKPTFQLMDFSYQAWNKITLGLAMSEDTAPSANCTFSPIIGVQKQVYWTVLKSMTLAVTTQVTMAAVGLTSDCWDGAMRNTHSRAIQNVAKSMFCEELAPGLLHPPPMSGVFAAIHSHLFSVPLASVEYASGERITCYSRQVVPESFIKVLAGPVEPLDFGISGLYTPTLIADVFVNMLTEKNIKFLCNMLPAYATSGTMGFSTGLVPRNMPRSGEMGLYVDPDTVDGMAPANKTFCLSDEHMWNNRVFMTSGPLKVVDHTTASVEESHGNINPRQRKTCNTWGVDVSPTSIDRTQTAGSCTITFPSITKHALLPIPVVGSSRRMPLSLAQQGFSPLSRECWRVGGCALVTNTETSAGGNDFWGDLLSSGFGRPASSAAPDGMDQRVRAQVIRAPEAELAPPQEAVAGLAPPGQ